MKIAIAQINPVVGDLKGNADKVLDYAHRAYAMGGDLVVFPELTLIGYPPHDLVEYESFVREEERQRLAVARLVPPEIGLILGGLAPSERRTGKHLHNSAYLYEDGEELGVAHKALLPTYDVFDELRHFAPGLGCSPIRWRGDRIGLHICEDLWNVGPEAHPKYSLNPVKELAQSGATLLINISASPHSQLKLSSRDVLIQSAATFSGLPYVFVNQVGANTELIFDGSSCVCLPDGRLATRLPAFEEALQLWEWPDSMSKTDGPDAGYTARQPMQDLHDALVLGIRDYFHKTGAFTKAVVGLSGGIDSAVTCALAVRALGPDRVVGVSMPSKFSSDHSVEDAVHLAEALRIPLLNIPIRGVVAAVDQALKVSFAGTEAGVAEENIQARARGTLLMALSNKYGYLVLATGNKSELAVGYATLYGDMNGGLSVLGDVFKGSVYALAGYINKDGTVIPKRTLTKAPSAELRPDQKDQDTLPRYEQLDEVLRRYIEEQESLDEIGEATGFSRELVGRILADVDRNEYKRRQAAPCLRTSSKAFGPGRCLPVVMRRVHR